MKKVIIVCIFLLLPFWNTAFSQTHLVEINFSGMQEYIGKAMNIELIQSDSKDVEFDSMITEIPESNFSMILSAPHAVELNVDFYVDINGNGKYDLPPTDVSWRRSVGPLHSSETINFINNTDYTVLSDGSTFISRRNATGSSSSIIRLVEGVLEIPSSFSGQRVAIHAFDAHGRLVWSSLSSEDASKIEINKLPKGIVFFKLDGIQQSTRAIYGN